ncbi:MAG: glycosyltransferase family 4 protein [Bacteroidota bacterium]
MAKFLFYDDKIINILSKVEKPSGGAAVQAYGWIRGLKDAGHEVVVMTNSGINPLLKEECSDIKLVPMYDPKKGIRWIRWVYYRLPYIFNKIKHVKPDYLYQGIPGWNSFFLALICKFLNVKYILRISNDYLLDERFYVNYGKTHRFLQKKGLALSHCILCQNDYQLNIIKKEYPEKLAFKISNPIFIKSENENSDATNRSYIAWLGLYQYQKNLKLLYEIACVLEHEQFYIAGKEESKCDEDTKYYLNKLKTLNNVTFTGFLERKEVLPFLSKAKFLLNTSHYEGFSNTFLEAMSVGTPIISTEKVNPDSIITKYNLGIIYKDLTTLQTQYHKISPDTYRMMSDKVKNYVTDQHDYKILSDRLLKLLSSN